MNYNNYINRVMRFIEPKLNLDTYENFLSIEVGKRVTQKMIDKAEYKMKITLPKQLVDFYLQIGDGIDIHWDWKVEGGKEQKGYNKNFVVGALEFPSLKGLKKGLSYWKNFPWRIFTSPLGWISRYYKQLPNDSPEKAEVYNTIKRAERCIPLWGIGNGDIVCIDNNGIDSPIVYFDHETMEFLIMDTNFEFFFKKWSEFCFQKPTEWFFNGETGGVNWMSDYHFYKPFKV